MKKKRSRRNEASRNDDGHGSRAWGYTDAYELYTAMRDMFAGILEDMLKAIHAQENLAAARERARAVAESLRKKKLKEAAKKGEDGAWIDYYMLPCNEGWVSWQSGV